MIVKRSIAACAIGAAALFFSAGAALATPLNYTFTGVGTGTISGNPGFTDAAFTVALTLNTTNITSPDVGYYEYSNVVGDFSLGAFHEVLTGLTIEVNGNPNTGLGNFEDVFLFNSTFGSAIGISQDAVFLGYKLDTPLTTGDVAGAQIGAFQDATGFTGNGSAVVQFTSLDSLNFTAATPGATPEPSTLAFLGACAFVFGLKRLKKA